MSCSQLLEAFQVIGEPPEEFVVFPDCSVKSHSYDDGECHIELG